MNKMFLFLFLSFIYQSNFAQKRFPKGAFLLENQLHSEVKNAKSIIFVIHGNFDVYPPKSTIEMYLEKLFKKSDKKVTFVYWDKKLNQLTDPSINFSDYDVSCLLNFIYIKKLDDFEDHRRQFYCQWQLICEKGSTAENLGYAFIEMNTGAMIFSENKPASQLIYQMFID